MQLTLVDLHSTAQAYATELASSAVTALYAVYYENLEYNEIGIWGYEFDSAMYAEQVAAEAVEQGQVSDPGRFAVFLQGSVVIEVWRDDEGSGECFWPLWELVRELMEAAGGLELPTD